MVFGAPLGEMMAIAPNSTHLFPEAGFLQLAKKETKS